MNQNSQQNPQQVQGILWFAMLASISTFYFVANFTDIQKTDQEQPNEMVKMVLLSMAIVVSFISYFLRKRAMATAQDPNMESSQKSAQVFTFSVLTWALSEMVAIFGFLTCFLFNDLVMGNALITAGLILLGFYRPISVSNNNLQR